MRTAAIAALTLACCALTAPALADGTATPPGAIIVKLKQSDHGIPIMGQILTIRDGGFDFTGSTETDLSTHKVTGGHKIRVAPILRPDGKIAFVLTFKRKGRRTAEPETIETTVEDGKPSTVDFPVNEFSVVLTAHQLPAGTYELPPATAATLDDDD